MSRTTSPIKVLHVIAGLWTHTGGPSESVPGLCKALSQCGHDVHIATLQGDLSSNVADAKKKGVHLHLYPPGWKHSVWYSPRLAAGVDRLAKEMDIIHVHGLWLHPMWAGCRAAIKSGKPLVMTPRGSLEPIRLKKSRWKKQLVAPFFDNRYLKRASCLHATAESEAEGFRYYGLENPVAVIPNGVDVPGRIDRSACDLCRCFPQLRGKRIMTSISRINPTKGLIELVEAIPTDHPECEHWHLMMFGPDERGHLREVLEKVKSRGLNHHITYGGVLNKREKWAVLAQSRIFVLPTKNENFGIAVAEALATGVPVITTHEAPWKMLEETRSGWWVPADPEGLQTAVKDAWSMPDETLKKMGDRGRKYVLEHLRWKQIAQQMQSVYGWLVQGGNPPAYVRPRGSPGGSSRV